MYGLTCKQRTHEMCQVTFLHVHRSINACAGGEIKFRASLTSRLYGGELLAAHSGRFASGVRY
jgi:hypothetical protein